MIKRKKVRLTIGKILIAAIISLITIVAIIVPAVAQSSEQSDDIVILYTNDVHTYIDNPLSYDVIAAIKSELKTQYKHVLLVDAGDHIQGTAYGSMDKGKTIIDLMNAAGYDAATLGNHEFDYGMFGCMSIIDKAQFTYVSCNFYNEENGVRKENVLDSYKMFELGDEKVALIGITTPETFTKSTPAYFQDEKGNYIYGISAGADGKELYADVQKAINDAISNGATRVIALGHLGDEKESRPFTSEDVIANVTGLDAFIDGHSHSVIKEKSVKDKEGNDVILTQTGEYFNRIGIMVIDSETGLTTTDFIECNEVAEGEYELSSQIYKGKALIYDGNVSNIKNAWISEIDSQLNKVIGSSEVVLDNYDASGNRLVRIQETNTGDFCADALYYLFDNMGMDVDFAIMNGGGIRNTAISGEISYKLCKNIHTFGNVACLQTVTGQQLLDALEWGAKAAGSSENGGFLHVSGITYKINTSVESTVQTDDKGVWIGAPTGSYRVYDVKVFNKEKNAWEELDLNASYNMAGYNYTLRDLGDGFAMFEGAINVLDYVMEDYMVLANYVTAFENGVVKANNSPLTKKYSAFTVDYGAVNGSGRIKTVSSSMSVDGLDNDIWFTKYGNVITSCTAEAFVSMGFEIGDIVTLEFLGKKITAPIVPDYTYVDSGMPLIKIELSSDGKPTGYVSLAINMGTFAQSYGLAIKKTDDSGNWHWEAAEGVSYPISISFSMAEKEGYLDQYLLRDLNRTNNRNDYPHLTDEQFGNFRVIETTGMGKGILFRTSSPLNPELGRNAFVMEALEKAGVTVIINLADSAEDAMLYGGYVNSYYEDQKVIYLNLGVDFASEEFEKGLAKGLQFLAQNPGVYAVHCNEGKDRAGFVAAVLECFMGASYDEVVADYMTTYTNYYGVEAGSEKYNAIAESNIIRSLCIAFGVDDISKADLQKEASEYLISIGLSESELDSLRSNLSKDAPSSNTELYMIIGICVVSVVVVAVGTIILVRKRKLKK